ncbi:alkyl hydroperoxide reductase [Elizabethkingia anophelis]|nr:alkyl hydroperoxide reductase [Elizabethkingia anophelis]
MKLPLVLGLIGASILYGQKIEMNFPKFSGKSYDFVLFQGAQTKVVFQGVIPEDGKFILNVPQEYSSYVGMSRWLITGTKEGGGLDMFIPGKDFSVSCDSETPSESNIIYKDNAYNGELNVLYKKQEQNLNRYETLLQATKVFSKNDPHYDYNFFTKGLAREKKSYSVFQDDLNKKGDYISQFIQIVNVTRGLGTELSEDEKQRAVNVNHYVVDALNWDYLYTSGHWYSVINSWLGIQTQVFKTPSVFKADFLKISSKLKSPEMYRDFTERVAYYLKEQKAQDYISAIAPLVRDSGKIADYIAPLDIYAEGYKDSEESGAEAKSNVSIN